MNKLGELEDDWPNPRGWTRTQKTYDFGFGWEGEKVDKIIRIKASVVKNGHGTRKGEKRKKTSQVRLWPDLAGATGIDRNAIRLSRFG